MMYAAATNFYEITTICGRVLLGCSLISGCFKGTKYVADIEVASHFTRPV